MNTQVFLTGATGFVGGSILSIVRQSHPEIHVKALIRKDEDAKTLRTIYPTQFEAIIGTLEDHELLTNVAATVDFVIHAAHDNIPAVRAMIDGLASSSHKIPLLPRFVSITGPRSLIDLSEPLTGNAVGNSRPWSDVEDVKTILSLPKDRIHADFDQASVAYGRKKHVGVMLISPGQILGRGKGHFKREGACALYYAAVKDRGKAFVVGDGEAAWSWVSVGDMAAAVVFLMQMAMSPDGRGRVGVNQEGYYFVQSGDLSMRERAGAVSERLRLGVIESLSEEEATRIHRYGPIMWGADIKFAAERLEALGWKPKELDWKALMAEEGGERA